MARPTKKQLGGKKAWETRRQRQAQREIVQREMHISRFTVIDHGRQVHHADAQCRYSIQFGSTSRAKTIAYFIDKDDAMTFVQFMEGGIPMDMVKVQKVA